jgi:REP element-mobilizing transposase RayT
MIAPAGQNKNQIMADTYTQIFYHIVFAVRNRDSLIIPAIKDDLYKYITGIITNQKQKLFIINGMPDHLPAGRQVFIF